MASGRYKEFSDGKQKYVRSISHVLNRLFGYPRGPRVTTFS